MTKPLRNRARPEEKKMNSEGVFPEQLGTEDLDKMVQVALTDDVIQSLLKTGEYVTQVSYLSLAFPDDDWTTPEVVAGLPVFFGHLPPAEMFSTPLSDRLFEDHSVPADGRPTCDCC